MTATFDFSDRARNIIDSALRYHTSYSAGNTTQIHDNNLRSRNTIIDEIFTKLHSFNSSAITFNLHLHQSVVRERRTETLFRQIANAICRNRISNFHFIAHGDSFHDWERHGKYVISWDFEHYRFKVYTRVSRRSHRSLNYFMNIVDTNQLQDDSGDSGHDTDEEVTDKTATQLAPDRNGRLDSVFTILDNMHNRINRLESTFTQSTALSTALSTTLTAFPPRLG